MDSLSPLFRAVLKDGEILYFYFIETGSEDQPEVEPFGLIFQDEKEEAEFLASSVGYEDGPLGWDVLGEVVSCEVVFEDA